jgi:hypothetical protein
MLRRPSRHSATVRAWRLAALAFMLVCTGVLMMGREHVYHDATGPGPGFFPAWVGGLGLVVGGLLLAFAHRPREGGETWTWPRGVEARRVYSTLAATFAAGLALDVLGFRPTLFAFFVVLLRVYGVTSWPRIVAIAGIATLAVHFVFNTLLKVLLPVGILGI